MRSRPSFGLNRETWGLQQEFAARLQQVLLEEVKVEWNAMLPDEKAFFPRRPFGYSRRMYGPSVDVAVGPFATDRQYSAEYDLLTIRHGEFLGALIHCHRTNVENFGSEFHGPSIADLRYANPNARAFLTLEIEKGNVPAKYLIGSILNAAALGRIGILVCCNRLRFDSVLRIREYVGLLNGLHKNVFNHENLLVVTHDQLLELMREWTDDSR